MSDADERTGRPQPAESSDPAPAPRAQATRRALQLRTEGEPLAITPHMMLLMRLGRALDDQTRVLVLALLAEAERPLYGQEIAERLHVTPQTVSHHLHILRNCGLVREQREQAFRYYTLDTASIQRIAGAIGVDARLGLPTSSEERAQVLATFLRDGRLVSIPRRRSQLRYVLEELARAFSPGRRYDEREVNAVLKPFHDDTASLRRGLVDERLLVREGGRYWLAHPRPPEPAPDPPGAG